MPVFQDGSTPLTQHKAGTFGFSAVKIDDLLASEYTLVGIAGDRSGSVSGFEREMEAALKEVVKACQKSPRADNLMARFISFHDLITEVHGFKMLSQINTDDYDGTLEAGGLTTLFDASVDIIESVSNYGHTLMENEYNANGIIFVITDGFRTVGKCTPIQVKNSLEGCVKKENLESVRSVLIGVNPGIYSKQLQDYKDECGFDQYVELKDASSSTLAKLAEFVSQSISSQSSQLGSGQSSVPIDPSVVF